MKLTLPVATLLLSGCTLIHATAGFEDGVDAGSDAAPPVDAGSDSGTDSGPDAATPPMDAGSDAGQAPPAPQLRSPMNGAYTGSALQPAGAGPDPLRPLLLWEPLEAPTTYEVQMDDSCAVDSFEACLFESPEVDTATPGVASGSALSFRPDRLPVATSAPVGTRYTWRVRACDGECGPWSTPRYLNVGRLADDINGDGHSDLIVGAPGESSGPVERVGSVYLYLGTTTGLGAPVARANPRSTNAQGLFGSSVALAGDFNADGFSDLLVGAEGQSNPESGEGNAFVYYGSQAGLSTLPGRTLDSPGGDAGGHFGISVTGPGDLNGDGYDDAVIGASEQGTSADEGGSAYVFLGGSSGVLSAPDIALRNPTLFPAGLFGESVSGAGDTNGDGFADLVVGAENQSSPEDREGAAFVFLGGPAGPSEAPDLLLDNPSDQPLAFFGSSIGSGDFNGDGYSDIAVGAYRHSNPEMGEGNAFVFLGARDGLPATPDVALDNPLDQIGADFGYSVASADVDCDGLDDVVVGARSTDNPERREGNVFVFYGTSDDGVNRIPDVTLDNPEVDGDDALFGSTVASGGDIDADGCQDLAAGAPDSALEGAAYVFFGDRSGLSSTPADALTSPNSEFRGSFGNLR